MGRNFADAAPARFDQMLQPRPSSVSVARGLVRQLVTVAGRDDLLDDAELLVSEIVTNALIHAGSTIRVRGRVGERGLRVEVSDASPHHPALRDYAEMAGTGRGLALMVDLVDDWGVAQGSVGKTVWFELGDEGSRETADHDRATRGPVADAPPTAEGVTPVIERTRVDPTLRVELLMMPLLLHEAWREHAETLLREYLLASLDSTAADDTEVTANGEIQPIVEDPIQVHADATDAMSLLEEQVPVADIDMEPAQLMAEATEPGVTAPQLWLEIPRTSVPHFATLERTLDRAAVLVDSGQVLAPQAQPEIQAFRHWVCRQVKDQSIGGPAVSWSIDRETGQLPAQRTPGVVLQDVTSSTESLIAADDTNQIVAVSDSARELLGYESADELVGERLVAIIPPRFHQAHIAGFTLHLLVGRSPLLGREVEVPALRRDATEVTVRLEINSRRAAEGATLFVARIRPVTPGTGPAARHGATDRRRRDPGDPSVRQAKAKYRNAT